jgi:predicted PurR-regulated permease PerM
VLVVALCLVAGLALVPFWAPLVMAAWAAVLAAPLHRTVVKRIHRRRGAAAVVTVLLALAFLTPLLVVTLPLGGAAIELGHRLLATGSGTEALRSLATKGGAAAFDLHQIDPRQLLELARQHGASAMGVAETLFGAAAVIVVGVVVFVSAFYTFLFEGPRLHEWLLVHAPMSLDPLRDRFDGVDGDGNGSIDEPEFSLLLDALGVGYSDAQVHAAFTDIDQDANGKIELAEFRAWWTTR